MHTKLLLKLYLSYPGLDEDGQAWHRPAHVNVGSVPSHRRQHLVAAIIRVELSAALPLDRGAARGGRGALATLKEQLKPSALRPALPAAKAALETLMQMTRSAAATISMINLMAASLLKLLHAIASAFGRIHSIKMPARECREIGPVLA